MLSASRYRVVWLSCLAALALGCVAVEAATLSLEDVVRLHVSGMSQDELIARIRAAEVDFDLAEPMLGELRAAGLPEPVIAAMIERQAALHPAPPPVATEAPDAAALQPRLVLHARGGGAAGTAKAVELRASPAPSPAQLETLRIADAGARIDDLALYVACVSATHVPDHWRMESPLGRDFEGAQRHRMLAFFSGAVGDEGAGGTLRLAIPATLEVPLESAESHQIVAGVAIRIGGRWVTTSRSEVHALAEGAQELELTIVQRGNDPRAVRIEIGSLAASRGAARPQWASSSEMTRETPGSSIVTP